MNVETGEIVVERPVVSAVIVALVAAVAYVGIQLVFDGAIAPLEAATFVAIFTVVYAGGNWMLRKRVLESQNERTADTAAAVPDETDAGPDVAEASDAAE